MWSGYVAILSLSIHYRRTEEGRMHSNFPSRTKISPLRALFNYLFLFLLFSEADTTENPEKLTRSNKLETCTHCCGEKMQRFLRCLQTRFCFVITISFSSRFLFATVHIAGQTNASDFSMEFSVSTRIVEILWSARLKTPCCLSERTTTELMVYTELLSG